MIAVWLIGVYVVALLTFPTDFGVRLGGVVLTPSRAVLLAAVILALVQWRFLFAPMRRVPLPVWIGWAAFLLTTLITALIAPSSASWARYGSLIGEGVVLFALVVWAASAPGGARSLATVFAATMAVVAGSVLLLALLGYRYDHILSDIAGTAYVPDSAPRYGLERQPGPFRASLYFAIWMTTASALLLPLIAEGRRRIRALALAGWLVLLVAVIFLTASRLAMTAIFLIPAAYFIVRGPRVVGVASGVAALGIAFGLTRLIPAAPVIVESGELRLAAISPAMQAISAKPLFGWGLLSDSTVLSDIIGKQNYVDNTYLSLAVETGLFGLGAFLLLAAAIVLVTRRAWATPLGLSLSIAVAGVLGMGILASVLQVTQAYAAFVVLAALAVAAAAPPVKAAGSPGPAAAAASGGV